MWSIRSSRPSPRTISTPPPDRWEKQKKLEAFKERIAKDQMPTPFTELGTKVLHTLKRWRQHREQAPPTVPPVEPSRKPTNPDDDLEKDIQLYREKADALHATLPVAGFVTQLEVPIDIQDIYVPLNAVVNLRGVADGAFPHAAEAEERLRLCDGALEIFLPEAFLQAERRNRRGVVILGDPGSGKTTHLKRLLLWCLRNDPESVHLPADMLPVFLPLRDLKNLDQGLDAFSE